MRIEPPAELISLIEHKKVLFLASKNLDYLRIVQETELIKKYAASCKILCYQDKSYLIRILKLFIALLFCNTGTYDVIYVSFLPQMVIPFFSWKWHKKQVITDFFISVYDTLIWDRRKFRDGTWIARLLKKIDFVTIQRSDFVIADTQAHADFFVDEFEAKQGQTLVWYLMADTSVYNSKICYKSKAQQGDFQVLYFGSILPLQGVGYVIEAAEILQETADIQFVVIGPVKEEKKALKNITYISWLPQKELAERIAGADLCLAGHFAPDIEKARRTIPGKAYIYEAMEKPMILGENPANHELFSEDNRHFFVEMGNAQALAKVILNFYKRCVSKEE